MSHISQPSENSNPPTGGAAEERKTDEQSVFQERMCCIGHGYWVIPVKPGGKGDLYKGWPEMRGLPQPFDPLYSSTSILTEGLRALDFDIDDPALAVRALAVAKNYLDIGGTIVRTRPGSARGIFLFRAQFDESSAHYMNASWPRKRRFELVDGAAIDVLGWHQQFVAFGPHSSGTHYCWLNGSPLTRRWDSLPVATDAAVDALSLALEEAGLLVKDTGRRAPGSAKTIGAQAASAGVNGARAAVPPGVPGGANNLTAGMDRDRLSVDQAVDILLAMPNNYPLGHPLRFDRIKWLDLAYACHAILIAEAKAVGGYDPDKERRLFEAFELFSGNYVEDPGKQAQSAARLWDSTRDPKLVTAGTLIHFAIERINGFTL